MTSLHLTLRPTLRTLGLTDEELMRQVNELALQQAERSSKQASERQKSAKVHTCEVGKDKREARAKNATTDGGEQLLLEIRQIKSEINDLKDQVNRQGSQAESPNWCGPSYRGRGHGYQPVQAGVVRIASRGEEERNVIIALLVVIRGMWHGNVTVTRTRVVDRETVNDYSGRMRNSHQQ